MDKKEGKIVAMKVCAYVPIKLNNSRLPGKNIMPLYDGTPLCKLLLNTLSKVKNVDEKYCFCSDDGIKEYLPEGIKFLKRDILNMIMEIFKMMVVMPFYGHL